MNTRGLSTNLIRTLVFHMGNCDDVGFGLLLLMLALGPGPVGYVGACHCLPHGVVLLILVVIVKMVVILLTEILITITQ